MNLSLSFMTILLSPNSTLMSFYPWNIASYGSTPSCFLLASICSCCRLKEVQGLSFQDRIPEESRHPALIRRQKLNSEKQKQLISYIAPRASATRQPATGNEAFLRPEIGFTAKWYHDVLGIDFGDSGIQMLSIGVRVLSRWDRS